MTDTTHDQNLWSTTVTPTEAEPSRHLPFTARRLLPVVLVLHGIAHFAGASVNLVLAAEHQSARLFAGLWAVEDPVVLITFAWLWAVLGAAFLVVAVMVWRAARIARRVLLVVGTASLVLCAVSLFAAEVGFAINLGLVAIAASRHTAMTEHDLADQATP